MKTTVTIPDEIYDDLKIRFIRDNTNLSEWVTKEAKSYLLQNFIITEKKDGFHIDLGPDTSKKMSQKEWDETSNVFKRANPELKP